MLVDVGKANMLSKVYQQPERVKMVLNKFRTDGLMPTLDAVRNSWLGYFNVGKILSVHGPRRKKAKKECYTI